MKLRYSLIGDCNLNCVYNSVKSERNENERNTYILGQLRASNTLDTLVHMASLEILLDDEQVTQGFMAGMQQERQLDKQKLITIYQNIQNKARNELEKRENMARTTVYNISMKSNAIDKNTIWVRVKEGKRPVHEKGSVMLTYSVKMLEGDTFDSINNIKIKLYNTLPSALLKGIKLAEIGGVVEMYALASSMGEKYLLPPNVRT